MKKFALGIFAIGALSLGSCSSDDGGSSDTVDNLNPANGTVLTSVVNSGETLNLAAGNSYILSSALRIPSGAVLNIGAGVTITAQGGQPTDMFVAIEQGGKIMAQGSDNAPIVFTSAAKTRGAWGGLIVAGEAPINLGETAIGEVGDIVYGGTNAADNSGTISYVRVEYTGAAINAEKQHNGIAFYGVGTGTTVDHIQAYYGNDDGIECFGGTVNLSEVSSVGSFDDSFDWAEGYSGTVTNLYIQHVSGLTQDKGIEGDNLKAGNGETPISDPTLRNVTIIGAAGVLNADQEKVDGMRLREGTKGTFENVWISGWDDQGIDIRSLSTLQNVNGGSLSFSGLTVENCGSNVKAAVDGDETDPGTVADVAKSSVEGYINGAATGADYDSWKGNWTK